MKREREYGKRGCCRRALVKGREAVCLVPERERERESKAFEKKGEIR